MGAIGCYSMMSRRATPRTARANSRKRRNFDGTVEKPLNREPKPEVLVESFISDKDVYDRNHGQTTTSLNAAADNRRSPIPHIIADHHVVHVDGSVANVLELPISYLESLPQHTVVAALQCAGNRRHTMRTKEKEVWGIDWRNGAVMNAEWSGVLLSDVLKLAAPTIKDGGPAHVAFSCYQTATQDDGYYGGSIPLSRALDADMEILLALRMNGRPLTPERGFPVRIIAPGVAGARAVKWLDRITVQRQESSNAYQQKDYKILPREVETKEQAAAWWHRLPSILETPVNSVIAYPESGAEVPDPRVSPLQIKGYALPKGSEGPVVRVEVSMDGGTTWTAAKIPTPGTRWSWVLWRYEYTGKLDERTTFLCRATDRGGNTQIAGGQWNLRGVAYNAYGELTGLRVANANPAPKPNVEKLRQITVRL
ncbi:hypothetical protein Dda_8550 [Drechslerella dactyloides]|uniref:Sulfite oxidase n=1 Tax=Drechslerella dactyloides TaxID=74499 RepID=A0AAD6IRP9_DREDA|nr:hypothetical protein Dda_8550 [Drechslerella dactyloides]